MSMSMKRAIAIARSPLVVRSNDFSRIDVVTSPKSKITSNVARRRTPHPPHSLHPLHPQKMDPPVHFPRHYRPSIWGKGTGD